MKLNNPENYESIKVRLSQEKTPIAFGEKVKELVGCGLSKEEAEEQVSQTEFELEFYYEKDFGLFAVEADAVGGGADIFSPYSREQLEDSDD